MHPTKVIVQTYKEGDYAETIRLADERLRTTPDDVIASQLRAYSLSFSKRSEEALEAYRETIEIVEGMVKKDPRVARLRGDLWFNLGCEFLKVGRNKPALAAITQSIRYEEANVEKARTNPLCKVLRSDPEFLRLIGDDADEAE